MVMIVVHFWKKDLKTIMNMGENMDATQAAGPGCI
jgi:hypothetical protein